MTHGPDDTARAARPAGGAAADDAEEGVRIAGEGVLEAFAACAAAPDDPDAAAAADRALTRLDRALALVPAAAPAAATAAATDTEDR
jgi:hypothetical protein